MSTEDPVDTTMPHRGRQQGLSPESHYGNSTLPLSPDSLSSICNLNDREANTSPDISMLECCLSEGVPVINPDNGTLSQGNVLCCTRTNLNKTFIATPGNGSMNFWNENLSLLGNQESGTKKYHTLNSNIDENIVGEGNHGLMSPDSTGRDSQLSSCEMSRRGSTENDCCSLSSGEMVLRSNSFCLEDQSLLVVSSLEQSSIFPAADHPSSPGESHILLTLPDICEKITHSMDENAGHPCLGMTFTQADKWELPTEDDLATPNSSVFLPSEKEGLLMTFVYENSPSGGGNEAQIACPEEAQFSHLSEAVTPKQGTTVMSTLPAVQNTSTPVQNIGKETSIPLPFSVSPFAESAGSPPPRLVKKQQGSVTPKQVSAGLPMSGRKVSKMEINKFPKPDNTIKSKSITRAAPLGTALQHKPSQFNVHGKQVNAHKGPPKSSQGPPKVKNNPVSVSSKITSSTPRRLHTGAASLIKSSGHNVAEQHLTCSAFTGEEQGKSRASVSEQHTDASKRVSAVQGSGGSSDTEQAASSQVHASVQHAGNHTSCFSEKSPDRSGQMDPKPTPKKEMSNKMYVKSGSALGQEKPPVLKIRPRCLSESPSSLSRPPKEKRATLKFSTSHIISKADNHPGQTKPGARNSSSQCKHAIQAQNTNGISENSNRKVKKIVLTETSKLTTTASSLGESKGRFRGRTPSIGTSGALFSKPPAASPRPASLITKQRPGILGRDDLRTSTPAGTPQSKLRNTAGGRKGQTTGELPFGTSSTASTKHQLNVSQTPSRPSIMGPPPTPASSRAPRKTLGLSRNLIEVGVHGGLSEGAKSAQDSGVTSRRATPFKVVVLKARLATTPGKNTGPTTTCKSATLISKGLPNSTATPLNRAASARLVHLTPSGNVDKTKPKTSSRLQPPDRHTSQPNQGTRPPDVVPARVDEGDTKDKTIQQLRGHLAASNCRFEAFTIVLQHALAERDESIRQCRRLSQELVNLRGELESSANSSERLEKEKEQLRFALDDALQKLQEQHQKDLAELEHRLQAFYQAEWDKVHQTYQEEADKCKSLVQQQMGELKANHEAMKLDLENSHAEQLQCVKQHYEQSLEELRKVHTEELDSLDKSLKNAEAALSGKVQELTVENNALIEKLTAEDNKRKELAESQQKDSHTVYLEQELESLKVVLDIKNKQLHQQEKKLMEVDKLTEKNVKLDESLRKVQQENEDLKARMERHAALSRQLSTEQAMLQESLQKESKVNKRLSMENEELLWKLHNGDLSSPRKVSPTSTSPSHSFSLQSPRGSAFFSSPPVSPR